MIEHRKGDLLGADAEALVNTVNTVGVMGKGVALQFRKAFPANYRAYKRACEAGEVQPGRMFVFETEQLAGPRLIINFPTKRHWRGKSRIEYIEAGLADLLAVLRRYEVRSVAIPPLGCGNGGLHWDQVRPVIESALASVDARVLLYAPTGSPPARAQRVATKRPMMTRVRAVLLLGLDAYRTDPTSSITSLVAQKMAYLMQVAGEPLKLEFVKGKYGPYAEVLNHALQDMEGHYLLGVGDRSAEADIRVTDGAVDEALAFLEDARDEVAVHVERVQRLIDGFDSPFGLELLTTVHWAAAQDNARTPDEALEIVAKWTPRKREVFSERYVDVAWERLRSEGWLPEQLAA